MFKSKTILWEVEDRARYRISPRCAVVLFTTMLSLVPLAVGSCVTHQSKPDHA